VKRLRAPLRFRLAALGFALGATAHFVAFVALAFGREFIPGYPGWRHALFTGIDATLAWGLIRRPLILAVALPLFFAQQLSSHGVEAWRAWAADRRVDWYSLVVLGFILFATVSVVHDCWRRRFSGQASWTSTTFTKRSRPAISKH
jgi:hypothetical protein